MDKAASSCLIPCLSLLPTTVIPNPQPTPVHCSPTPVHVVWFSTNRIFSLRDPAPVHFVTLSQSPVNTTHLASLSLSLPNQILAQSWLSHRHHSTLLPFRASIWKAKFLCPSFWTWSELLVCGSQTVVQGLEQKHQHHGGTVKADLGRKPTEWDILGFGSSNLSYNKPFGWLGCIRKFEKHWTSS